MGKEILENYGIKIGDYYKSNGKFYFKYNNNVYVLELVHNIDNTIQLLNSLRLSNNYDEIIKNKFGNIVTVIDGKDYILLKKNNLKYNLYEQVKYNFNKKKFE